MAAIIADAAGLLLIARRPGHGRLAGMWEFPGDRIDPADPGDPDEVARLIESAIGVEVQPLEPAGTVDHALTHVRLSYHAVRCRPIGGAPRLDPYTAFAWVDADSIRRHALPRAQRRIAALAFAHAALSA